MALYSNFPYTEYHQLNLDWLISEMKKLVEAWEGFNGHVDAEAYASINPEVTVTGDLQTGLTFSFGLPRGTPGTTGATGPAGVGVASATVTASGDFSITLTDGTVIPLGNIKGPAGNNFTIIDVLSSPSDLPATGTAGDAYEVYNAGVYDIYVWSDSANDWVNVGTFSSPSPSSVSPAMDGTASAGSSSDYARGDHVHPTDTSKQDKLATGTVTVKSSTLPYSGNVDLIDSSDVSTINSNSILTGTDLSSDDLGLQDKLVTTGHDVTVDGISIPINDDVDLLTVGAVSSINSNSLLTGTNYTSAGLGLQDTLINQSNIKSVNGNTLLGSGDLVLPTILYGTTDPNNADGNNGDIYIKYTA